MPGPYPRTITSCFGNHDGHWLVLRAKPTTTGGPTETSTLNFQQVKPPWLQGPQHMTPRPNRRKEGMLEELGSSEKTNSEYENVVGAWRRLLEAAREEPHTERNPEDE